MSISPASRQENFKEKEKRKRVARHVLLELFAFLFLTACLRNTGFLFFDFFAMSAIGSQLSVVKN
jgi:hypothetical protein